VTFTPDSQQLWVSSEMGGTVTVFDATTKQLVKTIPFAIQGIAKDKIQPVGIAIDKEQKYAYVALGPANRVAVVDVKTFEVQKYLLVGSRVWNLAFSSNQERLYTTNGLSNDISVIDTKTQTVTKSIAVGNLPWGIVIGNL
jgi:YVTN family beta-propeller protein